MTDAIAVPAAPASARWSGSQTARPASNGWTAAIAARPSRPAAVTSPAKVTRRSSPRRIGRRGDSGSGGEAGSGGDTASGGGAGSGCPDCAGVAGTAGRPGSIADASGRAAQAAQQAPSGTSAAPTTGRVRTGSIGRRIVSGPHHSSETHTSEVRERCHHPPGSVRGRTARFARVPCSRRSAAVAQADLVE